MEPRGLFRGCCEVMNALVPDFSLNWPGDAEIGRTQDGALFSKKHVLQQVHDTTPGPIQAHLETLGKVVELVMGHFSEGSPDMHELVKMAAKAAGEKHWKRIGAYNSREARGTYMTRFVRKIGITSAVQLSILRRQSLCKVMGRNQREQAEAGEEGNEHENYLAQTRNINQTSVLTAPYIGGSKTET